MIVNLCRSCLLAGTIVAQLLCFAPLTSAQAPKGATINFDGNAEFPAATVQLTVARAGQTYFTGSNGKVERGSPLFSTQVEAGATFYQCDAVTGFPQPIGNRPFINRLGASSFIAIKETPNGGRKFWINASVGAWRISGGTFISDWEYQIRYYSGDTNKNEPPTLTAGVIPNSGFYGGSPAEGKAEVLYEDTPDLQAMVDPELIQFDNGYRPGAFGSISVLVTNAGPGVAVGPIEISFYLSKDEKLDIPGDSPVSSSFVSGLAPGASQLVTTTPFQIPATFTEPNFYFVAAIDVGKKISETKDDNNNAFVQPSLPDLWPSLDFDFVDPRPGRTGKVKLTVRNDGKGTFKGALDVSLSVLEEITSPSEEFVIPIKSPLQIAELRPGGQETFDFAEVEIPKRILTKQEETPEIVNWIAKLDENDTVQELDEKNNVTRPPGLLAIKGYDIHGKVVTRWLKKPIEHVEIRVHRDTDNGAAPFGELVATGVTDANGEYRIEGLPYGDYLVEPLKPEWRISGFDGKLGDSLKLIDAVPGSQLVLKGDIEVLTFYGIGEIMLKSVDTSFGRMPFFLESVPLNVPFKVSVDWRGHEPGKILFIGDSGDRQEFPIDSDEFSETLDVGASFSACAVYSIQAVSADKDTSDAHEAFIVIHYHPDISS
jgi:hypothetical protein